jgi:hypothetical protein
VLLKQAATEHSPLEVQSGNHGSGSSISNHVLEHFLSCERQDPCMASATSAGQLNRVQLQYIVPSEK